MVMKVLANSMVVTIVQYISVTSEQVVHLKLTQCYRSITSQQSWREKAGVFQGK